MWCRFPGSEAGTGKGIGAVVVDLRSEGVSVAGTHRKMGLRGCTEAELAFDDVRIEPGDVLVPGDPADNSGLKTLLAHINHERCGNAAMCVGAAQGALEYAMAYMRERKVGTKLLSELQGLQWKIADMATELEGARFLLQRALVLAGRHGTPPPLESAMAKIACNLAAKFVCDEAIQLLGGYGYSREYPVERAYRDIRGLCIGAGTVEIQRNFVGHRAARGPRPPRPVVEGPAPMTPTPMSSPVDEAGRDPRGGRGRAVAATGGGRRRRGLGIGRRPGHRGGVRRRRGHPHPGVAGRQRRPRRRRGERRRGVGAVVGHVPPAVRRGAQPCLPGRRRWGSTAPSGESLRAARPTPGWRRIIGAWDALAAGHARVALVVTSDALVPGLGTAGETTTGAGAAAMVLGAIAEASDGPSTNGSSPAARLVSRTTRSMPAVDRYRADGACATGDVYDARLFREEVFVPLLTETGRAAAAESASPLWPHGPSPIPTASSPPPWPSVWARRWHRRPSTARSATPGPPPPCSASSMPVPDRGSGPTGRPGSGAGTTRGLHRDRSGTGVGGPRPSSSMRCAPFPAPSPSTGSGAGRRVAYPEALRARGQLEPMDDPIPMGLPAGRGRLRPGQPRDAGPLRGALPGLRDDLDPTVDPPHLHRMRRRPSSRSCRWRGAAACTPSS